jgi:hypothetical protein
MKKIKFLFAFAAIFFAALSAFTKPNFDTTVYGLDPNGQEHAVLLSQQNIKWKCVTGSDYCTYSDVGLTMPRETTTSYQFELIP